MALTRNSFGLTSSVIQYIVDPYSYNEYTFIGTDAADFGQILLPFTDDIGVGDTVIFSDKMGYLHATENQKDARKRSIGAVSSAIRFSTSCMGPIDTVSV